MAIPANARRACLALAVLAAALLFSGTSARADDDVGVFLDSDGNVAVGYYAGHRRGFRRGRFGHDPYFASRRFHRHGWYDDGWYDYGWRHWDGAPRRFRRGPRRRGAGFAADQPCRPVIREGEWRGRPARIGGSVCVDEYGRSYVVGEHAVEYLD